MAESARLLLELRKAPGPQAARLLQGLRHQLQQPLTTAQLDVIILNLLSTTQQNSVNLIDFIKYKFSDQSYVDAVCESFGILSKLLEGTVKSKLEKYIENIVSASLTVLRSACAAKIKEKCLLPLDAIINHPLSNNWSEPIAEIVEVLSIHIIKKTEKPSVLAKEFELIGSLSKLHPEKVNFLSESIGKSYLQTIEEAVEGKAKISLPLLEGCFNGLVGYLDKFYEPSMTDILYRGIKKFANPGEQHRRGHARATLRILHKHGNIFSQQLQADYKYWHSLLIKWINQSNTVDKQAAYGALFSFYTNVGESLMHAGPCASTMSCLNYFMDYFNSILSDKFGKSVELSIISSTYEVKYALKGFTTLISKCKNFFDIKEYYQISEIIMQRAILLYQDKSKECISITRDADENSTEKIEELCTHIEALAAIGINVDRNLENLICILISDFHKCLNHRQYIVISSLKQALKVVDVQIVTSHLIKESCRHCVCNNMYYKMKNNDNNDRDFKITYETFIPLWKGLFQIEDNEITSRVYDEFITVILNILPKLDLSTKNIHVNELYHNNQENDNEFNDLETFEMPDCPHDYRYFTNVCDLIATILPHKDERFIKWIDPIITMLRDGRRNEPSVGGYLRIAEAVFKIIKSLDIFSDTAQYNIIDETTDLERNITEIITDLSMMTTGIFQLRSALVFIQAPPQLLNSELIVKASTAFEIIFRVGKTNLLLATNALEVLEEWNVYLETESFRIICKLVIPILNDYLCSSGITDTNALNLSAVPISKNKKKKNKNVSDQIYTQLATLQHKIILFFAKVDSTAIQNLLNPLTLNMEDYPNTDNNNVIYMIEKLKMSLPYSPNKKLDIYLDTLVPRIKDIALHNTNRDTRLTACQTLHSIILLMYGTVLILPSSQKSSMVNIQTQLVTAMLHLAADSDEAISNMFAPLLKQSCHWLAISQNSQTHESSNFITVLLNEIGNSSSSIICEMTCQAMKEYICWSIKKSTVEQLEDVPVNISAILRSICQMMLNPEDNQRRGSCMLFISIVPQIYTLDSAIDKFLPELIYCIVKCIENTVKNQKYLLSSKLNIELGLKALDKALICLVKKGYILKKSSPKRRIPVGFGNALLDDILIWLLTNAKNNNRELAEKCLKCFKNIREIHYGSKSAQLLNNLINKDGPQNFIKKYLEHKDLLIDDCFCNDDINLFVDNLQYIFISIDAYLLFMNHRIIENDILFNNPQNILLVIKTFLDLTNSKNIFEIYNKLTKNSTEPMLDSKLAKMKKNQFDRLMYEISWKVYEFFLIILPLDHNVLKEFIKTTCDDLMLSLIGWIDDPYKLSLMRKNLDNNKHTELKNIIHQLKLNAHIDWIKYEDKLIESLQQCLSTFLINGINSPDIKNHAQYLNCLSEIIYSIDSKKQIALLSTLNCFNIVTTFVDSLFVVNLNSIYTSELDSSVINSMGDILTFILRAKCIDHRKMLIILADESPIVTLNQSVPERLLTRAGYFFHIFPSQLFTYVIENYIEIFSIMIENISERNHNSYTILIENIMKYISEKGNIKNETVVDFCKNLIIVLQKFWPKLIEWNVSFDTLFRLFSLLTITLSSEMNLIGLNKNNLSNWLLITLNDKSVEIEKKMKLIVLLPTILKPGTSEQWYNSQISDALGSLRECLPLSCHDCLPNTKKRSNYINIIRSILDAMANSGSYILLQNVMPLCIVDYNHICDEQISRKVKLFITRLSDNYQLEILQEVFNMLNSEMDTSMLFNLINRFLIPLMLHSSPEAVETFFINNIVAVFSLMNKKISVNLSQFQTEHIFVEWIGTYKMLEVMFLNVPFLNLDSAESRIASCAYGEGSASHKLVKDVFTAAFKMRSIELPIAVTSQRAKEFLRLAHCSAFKCLYAITIVKPKVDKKFYMILINHKSTTSQRFWEGMIDLRKEYNFPIKTDQIVKEKNYSVASKTQNFTILAANGMTFQDSLNVFSSIKSVVTKNEIDNRHSFLSQTLTENIFKFDLNTAVIRSSFDQSTANQKMKQVSKVVQSSLSLTENDLNSHECMATVCKLIRDIDEITEYGDDNTEIPEWVKCISDLLSDSTRERNVRLFMAHVIDNTRDIFKRYSKIVFVSLMSVIEDRCTGFNPQINYLDVCLISTLLSWKNRFLPESHDEVLSASKVLRFLISEINSTSQEHSIFKHSLELLNTFLSIWGPYLIIPYDLLIEKLKNESSNKKAGVQIVASLLMNDIVPWENLVMYEEYKNIILSCLKSEDRDIYKSSAEVIGLTLKILTDKPDETEIFETLLKDTRAVISKFFDSHRDKFIVCIYNVQNHFIHMCDDTILPKVIFLLPKLVDDLKKMCFQMILNSMDVLSDKNIYGELISLGIDVFIKDFDFQIPTLHIVNKAISRLTSLQINKLIKDMEYLCGLSNHNDRECRAIVYEILIKLYAFEFSEQNIKNTRHGTYESTSTHENVLLKKRQFCEDTSEIIAIENYEGESHFKKCIKSSLLQGLDDDDNELKMKIFKFWTEQYSSNIHERLINVFKEFFNDKYNIDSKLLGCILRIIVSTCWKSPLSMDEKVFPNPLEVCDYIDYDWKTTGDKQSHVLTPMFAETLNSQLLASTIIENSINGNTGSNRDANTLRSMINSNNRSFFNTESMVMNDSLRIIDQTLIASNNIIDETSKWNQNLRMAENKYENTFSLATESSFLFSVEPTQVNFKTYKPLSRNQKGDEVDSFTDNISKKFRKQFITSKKLQAIKFSGLASYKQKLKEDSLLFKKPLDSFKRFRQGDYPDVQFTLKDILSPLIELAARDTILAKDLFIIIFKALYEFNDESITVENFSTSSIKYSLQFLKYASKFNLDPTLVHALLEICQRCLHNSHKIDEFDAIVSESAKLSGIEWLGTLVIEEKQIFNASIKKHSSKRFKIDANIEQRCNVIKDEIYQQRLVGNWTQIQNILETATQDDLISDEKKLEFTKENLECFARLSNWDNLIDFVNFQVSTFDSDTTSSLNLLNYDRLWAKPWMKNFLLSLMFDANIHKLNSVHTPYGLPKIEQSKKYEIMEYSNIFDVYINEWIGDAEKNIHLRTNLSSKVAIWKAIYHLDENPMVFLNNAIDHSRLQWINEFQSQNNISSYNLKKRERNSPLRDLQMMGEIHNLSDLPLSSSFDNTETLNSSLRTLMKTWKNCVPINNDDTILWDLRLACRSTFTCHLQKTIKTHTDEENLEEQHENLAIIKSLSHTQRSAELCLVKTALSQLNHSLAYKYIRKNCKYLDPEEEITWALQLTNSDKIKIGHETNLDNKLNAILKVWKSGEEIRISYNCSDDPFSYVELLKNAADMSLEVYNVFKLNNNENTFIDRSYVNENLIEIMSKGNLFREPIAHNVMKPESLSNILIKYSNAYLKESIKISEDHMNNQCHISNLSENAINKIIQNVDNEFNKSKSLCFVSTAYLRMANHCRKVINENLNQEEFDLMSNLVVSVLRAMKYGNHEARKMFPILFVEFERLPPSNELFSIFKKEIMDIPCWLFLPWVSQLLAYMPKFHNILLDLIVKISKNYPQAIVHQYRLSKKMWKDIAVDNKEDSGDLKIIIKTLDSILHDQHTETFVNALSGVCEPYTLLMMHLENVLRATLGNNDKNAWDRAFNELFEEVFLDETAYHSETKLRGQIFKQLKSTKTILEKICKSGTSSEMVMKGRMDINEFLQTHMLQNKSISNTTLKSIKDFSPYLATCGENSLGVVEIFGQYGKFSTGMPNPNNHVTVVKFESEVMVIGSLRKPIRLRVIGSDGIKYTFLVKRGEDLRQDERIQQLFGLMNDYLYNDGMKINTYKVIPLTWDLGVIEWINNCPRLRDVLLQYNSNVKELIESVMNDRLQCIQEAPGNTWGEKFGNMAGNINEFQQSYNMTVEKIPKYMLRDAFVKLAISPDKFVHMRNNYIKSLAPMNISHWILGIGDRHLSNCLISLSTGGVIGIDFGYAFGTATQMISVPEMLPFRLTPQFLGVLAPDGAEGNLRQLMITSLKSFIDNSTLLLATMEIFVHEPAMNWLQLINKSEDENISSCPIRNLPLCQWSPRSKINQCKKKLSGINPISITLEDIRNRTGDKFMESYTAIAKNAAMYYNPNLVDQELLSVSQQVNCLISQATNSGILAVTFHVLEPWL